MTIPDLNPLGYTGLKQKNPSNVVHHKADPTQFDNVGFDLGDIWINTVAQTAWILVSKSAGFVGTKQTALWKTIT